MPIRLQVGESLVCYPRRRLRSIGRPIALDAVACDLPELRLIGILWQSEMIAMGWKHANVHVIVDARAPKHWPHTFPREIDRFGQDTVMFGRDVPMLPFERMRRGCGELSLRPGPRRRVLRDTALRIHRLEG